MQKGGRPVKRSLVALPIALILLIALPIALIPLATVPVLAQTTSGSSPPPDQCSATDDQYQTCPPPVEPPVDPAPEPPTVTEGLPPTPVEPAPEPPPIITLEQAGAAALKGSLTASGVLNDNRKDSARGLEEEGSPTAETPPIARATAASETESVSTEVDAVGIDEKEAVQPASETESVPAEVDAVGIDKKEAVQPEKLDLGTKDDSTKDVAAAEAVDGDENGASREEELSPGPKDHPPTVTTEAEAIDPKESEAALRPAESPAERQAVAPRSMETVQLLDMPSTSPLLASALVVAAGLLIRRSMR